MDSDLLAFSVLGAQDDWVSRTCQISMQKRTVTGGTLNLHLLIKICIAELLQGAIASFQIEKNKENSLLTVLSKFKS